MSDAYGEGSAEFYDEIYGPQNPGVVRALSNLASNGSVLELGVATGRTALALSLSCNKVCGIDQSRSMLERLAGKVGADALHIIHGDFAVVSLDQRFDLIFALVNTFFLLETHEQQHACLRNMRGMLKETGVLLLETYQPSPSAPLADEASLVRTYRQTVMTSKGGRIYESRLLHRTETELDRVAEEAGLELRQRWGDWRGSAYRKGGQHQISIYGAR